ncbi:TPA: archaeal proteasome endopeptidase complex subunit beta [archaeon]|uniref:Proteasome subunit beta n=1 Tax=Candidatus Naiadarchaeum limnaeum TaxID=2756139 RepID=A0A832V5H2_9ARCH|nr:archaeal proteasome endopeptidase complex subunit beta [Candidatus Naiadarchaeum limnaeum]
MADDKTLSHEQVEKYLKGTTTVGIVCKDGVVLASDSRATMGYLISDKEAQKIFQIDDKVAITTAGLVGDNQSLVRIMRAQLALARMEEKPLTIKATSTLLANILHSRRYYPFLAQLIVGGFDTEGHIFELDPVGGMSGKKVSSTGSGSPVAYGAMETAYRENMTVQDGIELVTRAIYSARERNAGTGNKIEVVTITDKGFKKLTEDQVKKTIETLKAQ